MFISAANRIPPSTASNAARNLPITSAWYTVGTPSHSAVTCTSSSCAPLNHKSSSSILAVLSTLAASLRQTSDFPIASVALAQLVLAESRSPVPLECKPTAWVFPPPTSRVSALPTSPSTICPSDFSRKTVGASIASSLLTMASVTTSKSPRFSQPPPPSIQQPKKPLALSRAFRATTTTFHHASASLGIPPAKAKP